MINKKYDLNENSHFKIFANALEAKTRDFNKETRTVAYYINMQIINAARKECDIIGLDATVTGGKINLNYTAESLPKGTIGFLMHALPAEGASFKLTRHNGYILNVVIATDYFNSQNFNRADETQKKMLNAYNTFARQQRRTQSILAITCEQQADGWLLVNTADNISFICKRLPLTQAEEGKLLQNHFEKVLTFDDEGVMHALFQNALDTEIFMSQPEAIAKLGEDAGATWRTYLDGMIHNVKIKFHQRDQQPPHQQGRPVREVNGNV